MPGCATRIRRVLRAAGRDPRAKGDEEVAIGPDGALVSELKDSPGPLGESRIWRVEPDARHVHCEPTPSTRPAHVVADGFTSIVDLTFFGSDGTAYVVELDEASFMAVEFVTDARPGEKVNTCPSTTWVCTEAATDLTMPMALAINDDGAFVVVSALIPG